MSKNKRGGAPTDELAGLVIFIFVAVFGFIFLRLINISTDKEIQEDITQREHILDAHENLMAFLRHQHKGASVADAILNSYYSKDFSGLEKVIKEFFNSKYSNDWLLIIEDSERNAVLSADPNNFLVSASISLARAREEVAVAYLPLNPAVGKYLKIRLIQITLPSRLPY